MLLFKHRCFPPAAGLAVLLASLATAEPLGTAAPYDVTFPTKDKLTLHGTMYPGAGEKGVLCLHGLGGSAADYADLAGRLAGEGFWVLAVDFRGHGRSAQQGGAVVPYQALTPADYRLLAEEDVAAALEFLGKQGRISKEHLGVVGASLGANAALHYASRKPGIRTLVLLSPGLNYRGLLGLPAMKRLAALSVYLVASRADTYSAESVTKLADQTGVPVGVKFFDDAGHGTRMLVRAPELPGLIVDWMKENL